MAITKYDGMNIVRTEEGVIVQTHEEFVIDSSADLANLPGTESCLAGSLALDASNGDIYIMDSTGTWNKKA